MNRIPRADFLETVFWQLRDFQMKMRPLSLVVEQYLARDTFVGFLSKNKLLKEGEKYNGVALMRI